MYRLGSCCPLDLVLFPQSCNIKRKNSMFEYTYWEYVGLTGEWVGGGGGGGIILYGWEPKSISVAHPIKSCIFLFRLGAFIFFLYFLTQDISSTLVREREKKRITSNEFECFFLTKYCCSFCDYPNKLIIWNKFFSPEKYKRSMNNLTFPGIHKIFFPLIISRHYFGHF